MNIKAEYIPLGRTTNCALRTVFVIIPTLAYCDVEIVESFHAIWDLISWPITKLISIFTAAYFVSYYLQSV